MAADFIEQVQAEVERIRSLDLSEQPEAWAQLRNLLETTLVSAEAGASLTASDSDQSAN
jgi:hypothetical protein